MEERWAEFAEAISRISTQKSAESDQELLRQEILTGAIARGPDLTIYHDITALFLGSNLRGDWALDTPGEVISYSVAQAILRYSSGQANARETQERLLDIAEMRDAR